MVAPQPAPEESHATSSSLKRARRTVVDALLREDEAPRLPPTAHTWRIWVFAMWCILVGASYVWKLWSVWIARVGN